MNTPKAPTPRTEAAWNQFVRYGNAALNLKVESEKLEAELIKANATIESLERELACIDSTSASEALQDSNANCAKLLEMLATVQTQRGRMRIALQDLLLVHGDAGPVSKQAKEAMNLSDAETKIEAAARELAIFLRTNIKPYDAPESQSDEWPCALTADNEDDAVTLATMLGNLENSLIEAGRIKPTKKAE